MLTGDEFLIEPTSDYEVWTTGLHAIGYSSFEFDDVFKGSARGARMWGIPAADVAFASRSISQAERTQRQVRIDGKDYYKAVFQMAGRSTLIQNGCVTELAKGECGLVDMARPSTLITDHSRWVAIYMPRRSLTSHLGLEPNGGVCWRGATPASRLLFHLVLDAISECDPSSAPEEPYMQFAIYDLFGALLAISDLPPNSSHTDKLFARVCSIAKSRFSDPEITLRDVAAEAGISLRYLQTLFTTRGTTCSRFVQSLRLDHAARLLNRRKLTRSGQSLAEIAYACGFSDYAHFSRTFRRRFGCTPSAASEGYVSGDELLHDCGRRSEIA